MAFKKTFSYAGFAMQPKKYQSPKIALLNIELELKAEKDNAEIRVDNVKVIHYLKGDKLKNLFYKSCSPCSSLQLGIQVPLRTLSVWQEINFL